MDVSTLARTTAPPGVEAVLLDYGGTLDADGWHWFDHFAALYAQSGVRLSREALRQAFYSADRALACEPGVADYGLERMTRAHVRLQLAHLALDDPGLERRLAGAFIADSRRAWNRNRSLLRRLAERFRLGVVSNSYGNMPTLLAEAGLGPFEVVLDSALVGLRKPDPALYALACRRLGLRPAAILHVGDSWERDVLAAHSAGLHTAWVAPAGTPLPQAVPPAATVWRLTSIRDLEVLLR